MNLATSMDESSSSTGLLDLPSSVLQTVLAQAISNHPPNAGRLRRISSEMRHAVDECQDTILVSAADQPWQHNRGLCSHV